MNDGRGRVNGRIEGWRAPTSREIDDDPDMWEAALDALDDQQMDALLGGSVLVEELAPVAEVMRRLRQSAIDEPLPPMGATLRALLDEPPARRARHAPGPSRHAVVKAAAVAAAVAVLAAGAAENRLPAGIQDVVSSSANLVGISVPRAEDRHAGGLGTERLDVGVDDPRGDERAPDHEGASPGGARTPTRGTTGDRDPSTRPVPNKGGGTPEGSRSETTRPTEKATRGEKASPTGQANGTGVAGSHGKGSTTSSPRGQTDGTGTAKAG